jgi:hypothetical protein
MGLHGLLQGEHYHFNTLNETQKGISLEAGTEHLHELHAHCYRLGTSFGRPRKFCYVPLLISRRTTPYYPLNILTFRRMCVKPKPFTNIFHLAVILFVAMQKEW